MAMASSSCSSCAGLGLSLPRTLLQPPHQFLGDCLPLHSFRRREVSFTARSTHQLHNASLELWSEGFWMPAPIASRNVWSKREVLRPHDSIYCSPYTQRGQCLPPTLQRLVCCRGAVDFNGANESEEADSQSEVAIGSLPVKRRGRPKKSVVADSNSQSEATNGSLSSKHRRGKPRKVKGSFESSGVDSSMSYSDSEGGHTPKTAEAIMDSVVEGGHAPNTAEAIKDSVVEGRLTPNTAEAIMNSGTSAGVSEELDTQEADKPPLKSRGPSPRYLREEDLFAQPFKFDPESAKTELTEDDWNFPPVSEDEEMDRIVEETDYPLWVEEDDPSWPDEADEGWGFRVDDFFKDIKIVGPKGDGVDDIDFNKKPLPDRWTATEISSLEWEMTVFGDMSPLLVLIFQRYGQRTRECYKLHEELEDAVNRIWDSHKLPPRVVKIDASLEIGLASALHVEEYPTLFFIKAGKVLHTLTGDHVADELVKIIAYFFYGAGRPSCLEKLQTPQNVAENISSDP